MKLNKLITADLLLSVISLIVAVIMIHKNLSVMDHEVKVHAETSWLHINAICDEFISSSNYESQNYLINLSDSTDSVVEKTLCSSILDVYLTDVGSYDMLSAGFLSDGVMIELGCNDLILSESELSQINDSDIGMTEYSSGKRKVRLKWFTIDACKDSTLIQKKYVVKQDSGDHEMTAAEQKALGYMILMEILFIIQCAISGFIYNQIKHS